MFLENLKAFRTKKTVATPMGTRFSPIPGWCNGSTRDSGSFSLGSSPSPGANLIRRHGQEAKTSPSQGEIMSSILIGATRLKSKRSIHMD